MAIPLFIVGDAAAFAGTPAQPTQWFVGHFMPAGDIRHSADVEVKWGVHKAGDRNESWSASAGHSLSIAVSGTFRLEFGTRTLRALGAAVLSTPGQYALWRPRVYHDWEAVTDCVVVTVRWPSVDKA